MQVSSEYVAYAHRFFDVLDRDGDGSASLMDATLLVGPRSVLNEVRHLPLVMQAVPLAF